MAKWTETPVLRKLLRGVRRAKSLAPSSGPEPLTYKIHDLRHEIGMDQTPYWGFAPLIPDIGRLPKLGHLAGYVEADLCVESHSLGVPTVPRYDTFEPVLAAHKAKINRLFLGSREAPREVKLLRFENVYLSTLDARFALYALGQMDKRTTAVPSRRALEAIAGGRVRRMDHALYCGDRFPPNNPAHSLGDHLARAVYARDILGIPAPEIVLPKSAAPVALGVQREVDPDFSFLASDEIIEARSLTLFDRSVQPNGSGHPLYYTDPHVTQIVREAALRVADRGNGVGPKVYLSRQSTARRPLVNEAELMDRLQERGFQRLVLDDLSAEAQLAAIKEAEQVVAPHGAALTTLLAAGPQTKCLELFHPRRGTMTFLVIAAALGVPYDLMFGEAIDQEKWRVDVDAVLARVDRMSGS